MKIIPCIFILLLSLLSKGFAQTDHNWHKGFVLLENKTAANTEDTLRGEVLYDGWGNTPNSVDFRLQPTGAVQTFTVADCMGFGVNTTASDWEYCKRFGIDLEISETNLNLINQKKQPQYVPKTLFLRAVCIGSKANLWVYSNADDRAHLFVQIGNANPTELVKKQYYTDENKSALATNAMYRQQLATTLVGCKKTPNWAAVAYSEQEIGNIFENYNTCLGSNNYRVRTEKMKAEGGVLAGAGGAILEGNDYKVDYTTPSAFPVSLAYTAGLYLNLILPRSNNHWSIYNELLLSTYHIERNSLIDNPYSYKLEDQSKTTIAGTYISLNTMVRYTAYNGKSKHYIGLGITNAYALDITQKVVYNYKDLLGVPERIEGSYLPSYSQRYYTQGIVADVGFQYKKHWGMKASWQITNGFSDITNIATIFNYGYLIGTYAF